MSDFPAGTCIYEFYKMERRGQVSPSIKRVLGVKKKGTISGLLLKFMPASHAELLMYCYLYVYNLVAVHELRERDH
jgi:hypothetical protein